LAKANRNSSPTYSLVLFAPSHSLRMGDFFQKAVKTYTPFPYDKPEWKNVFHSKLSLHIQKWSFPAAITVTLQQLPEPGKRQPSPV
ncbi:hypothetical protein, partial [Heyndrickxia coagulans]|nr:hypothetical protein [Heyndrickxia coagulans]